MIIVSICFDTGVAYLEKDTGAGDMTQRLRALVIAEAQVQVQQPHDGLKR